MRKLWRHILLKFYLYVTSELGVPQHFVFRGQLYTVGPNGVLYSIRHTYTYPVIEEVTQL